MAKGAGMIEPNMATMLGFVTTDAAVAAACAAARASRGRRRHVQRHHHRRRHVDQRHRVPARERRQRASRSTRRPIRRSSPALREVCGSLARAIVRGGEGATKLVAITATGASSEPEAKRAAQTIANSLLVKTAIHGGDPNWGRLVAAAGRAGVAFDVEHATVRVGPVVLFKDGVPFDDRAPDAAAYLAGADLEIDVDLGAGGTHSATVWTCDLSAEYVAINADYRT